MIDEIRNRKELVALVNEIGFLPFFSGRIEGLSLEENISYDAWYHGRRSGKIHWDAWEWKAQEVADVVSRIGVPIPGSKNKERIIENLDSANVELTDAEFTELEEALSGLKVYGHRGLGGF